MSERNDWPKSSECLEHALEWTRDPIAQLSSLFELAVTHPIDDGCLDWLKAMAWTCVEKIILSWDPAKIASANRRMDLMTSQLNAPVLKGAKQKFGTTHLAANDDDYAQQKKAA